MTAILVGILFGVLFTFMIGGCLMYLRNTKVYTFRTNTKHRCYDNIRRKFDDCIHDFEKRWIEYLEYSNKLEKIANKWKYQDMLYSHKPLKLEYWYTDDEIELINNLKQ